jgi:ABC-2 type transport system permease protein
MSMNLFIKELRRNVLSLIIWMIVITMLISVTMSVYRTFLENQSKIMGMMSLIPKGALQFKGISNFNDLLSVLGFYAANNVIYMMMLGSIYAIVLSSNILLKEEYNKTAEYLLTRPLTRSEIFFSKTGVVFLYVFILNLVTSLAGLICIQLVKTGPFSIKAFLILSLYTMLLNFLFAAIGLFLSTLIKRAKPITTFSIGLVLIFYFIYTLSKITESAAKIGYLSPFKFVRIDAISPAYRLEPFHLLYFTGISFLLIVTAHWLYKRKDIYT